MAAFATSIDVSAAWRTLTTEEAITADWWLDQASEIIRDEFPTIDARIAAGRPSAAIVRGITVAMTVRHLQNPEGFRSVQESIEDYSTTHVLDASRAGGDLYLTDAERVRLGVRRGQAFSIVPSQEPTSEAMVEQIGVHRAGWDR